MIEEYSDNLHPYHRLETSRYLLWENMRFLLIQIFIACLQLLNRSQITFILLANSVFFAYSLLKIFKKHNVVQKIVEKKSEKFDGKIFYIKKKVPLFKSKVFLIKVLTQEICIQFVLVVLFTFAYFKSPSFQHGNFYNWLEKIFIIAILLTVLTELLWLLYQIMSSITDGVNKLRNRSANKVGGSEKVL